MANTVCLILGICSSILSLACVVVALASSQWFRIRTKYMQNDVGLMIHCDVDSDYCGDMERLSSLIDAKYATWFRSVQALYLIHSLGLFIITVTYILYAIRFMESKGSFRALTAFSFLTLACGVYAVAIYGANHEKYFGLTDPTLPPDAITWGYGFYMGIVGCCLSFLVMVFSALEASQAIGLIQNMQNRLTVWTTPYTLFVDQEA